MRYFKATASDGRTHTRSSTHRNYGFAVTAGSNASWAGDLELAVRRTSEFAYLARRGIPVEVHHAVEITAKEYRTIKAAKHVGAERTARLDAADRERARIADHVDGYDRDDLGESPDF